MDGHWKRRDHGHKSDWAELRAERCAERALLRCPRRRPSLTPYQRRQPWSSGIPQPKATGSAAYGTQGYNVVGNASRYPTYATIQPYGELTSTWTASTTASQALEDASGTGRIAAEWYSATSFVVNVDMVDGQAHDLALYALDWNNAGRVELIQVTDGTTGAMLDTETISNFTAGVYLQWVVSGDVMITVTTIAGPNAELSGLFLDPPSTTGAAKSDVLNISYPTTDTAGTPQSFTVTALSPSGGTDTHYTGTIHFTSSDPQAVLPGNYMFNTTDAGVHTFTVALKTVGIQSITATDTTTSSITGTESNITVKPASAYSLTVSGLPNPETAGTAGNFTVTVYDQLATSPPAILAPSSSPAAIPKQPCRPITHSLRLMRGSIPSLPRSTRWASSRSPRLTRSRQPSRGAPASQ